jgi:imidazolonepropionase-like amidohydrolase
VDQRTIFTSATLYDGRTSKQAGMTVVVEGGRIAAIHADRAAHGDGRRIDLAGKTLMPGMTVGHWHGEFLNIGPPLFASGRAGTFVGTELPPAILALQAASALRSALMSGVLRVISAACSNNLDGQMKMALESGLIEGADIMPCSRHILGTADQEDRGQWWRSPAPVHDGLRRIGGNVFADGADAFVRAVRQEILFGAEIIKTYVDGGHGLDWTPGYRSISLAELRALVAAAHERDKRVRVHVTNKESILKCIEAGVDILDHCDYLDEECIAAMVERGTYFVPSPVFGKLASSAARGERLDPANPTDRTWLNLIEMMPKANAAGVRIVPGDDFGAQGMQHAPGVYGRELEIYVKDFGIPAEDVIRWATANGAQMALADHDTGTIEAGKAADFIVVDGDPGAQIGILCDPARYLKLIVQRGRIVKNELDAALG